MDGSVREVCIGLGAGQGVVIKVLSRAYPEAEDWGDGNWLNSVVEVSLGSFKGAYHAMLRSNELKRFADELVRLDKTLKGKAEYRSMEDWLSIDITCIDKLGHLEAEVVACDEPGGSTRLSGKVMIDQAYCKDIVRGLQRILERYPVQG